MCYIAFIVGIKCLLAKWRSACVFFSLGSRSKSRSSGGAVTLTSQVAQVAFLAWLEVNQNWSRLKGKVITLLHSL